MKEIWKKVKAFVKKNYIACTVVAAIILVIVASLIIIGLINMNKNKIEVSSSNVTLYQYFNKERKDFGAKLSYENDALVNIDSEEYKVYENSPLYNIENTHIIIHKESSIIFYYRQNLSYRLPKYSVVTYDEGSSIINSKGKEKVDTDFFIYDGVDTYIFPVSSILKVNNTTIELSKYSYVIANNNYVTYYSYDSDTIQTIEGTINKVTVKINDIAIDLMKDATVVNSKVGLLNNNVSSLDIYLED